MNPSAARAGSMGSGAFATSGVFATSGSKSRAALLTALISLPFLISLFDLKDDPVSNVPSALSLALLFIHLLSLPALSWLFAYRSERGFSSPSELMLARFGHSRLRFVLRSTSYEWMLTFALGYGLSATCIALNYGEFSATAVRELELIFPVTLLWTAMLAVIFQTIRSWTRKLGLWVTVIIYPLALSRTVPLGSMSQLDHAEPTRLVILSPFHHLAHVLGALVDQTPCAGWVSLAVIATYGAAALVLFLLKVPR